MSFPFLYQRTKAILLSPGLAWEEIISDGLSRRKVIFRFLLPWALILGFFTFLGVLFYENIYDPNALTFIFISGSFSFFIIFLEVYISGWIITELTGLLGNSSGSDEVFNLVIFSHTPFFIVLSLTHLFPQLMFINVFGIYSFFVFWTGIDKMTKVKEDNRFPFLIVSSLIMLALFMLLSFTFNNIYDTILEQLTVFAAR